MMHTSPTIRLTAALLLCFGGACGKDKDTDKPNNTTPGTQTSTTTPWVTQDGRWCTAES